MKKSVISFLVLGGVLGASGSTSLAQGQFKLPQPDLSVVRQCVLDNRGDLQTAAQCYASFDSICFDKWFDHYSVCLPQEAAYWSDALNKELERAGAPEKRAQINTNMSVACPTPRARHRQICEARYLRDNTVLLHIRRTWGQVPAAD
ncbi:hypothetical protein PUV54_07950 [Hyphococcus flavus]|uniref:Uncharacterized protein n=1 Tax=Hyphococcus flavus TaxID=1866326 RepID=A0AAE9ZDL8_9PROT|nr:hypothetical protein [Hyphococcus flavus]WDI33128.1 hypothetical protein PUV54_07950 [Hyphococcus flavus]